MESPVSTPMMWPQLRNEMAQLMTDGEERYRPLLDLFPTAESIGRRIVEGERSLAFGDRPWEYVAAIATITAARLAVSGISLALSGYPDCAAILSRTIWENRLRLAWICKERLSRSLRFLWADADSEIRSIKAQPKDTIPDQEAVLASWVDYRQKIVQHGIHLGATEDVAKRLPSIFDLARELGQMQRHDTWYARHSQLAHARAATMMGFLASVKTIAGENGMLFPTRFYRLKALHSLGSELFSVLIGSAQLVGEHQLEEEAHRAAHAVDDEFSALYVSDPESRTIEAEIRRRLAAETDANARRTPTNETPTSEA